MSEPLESVLLDFVKASKRHISHNGAPSFPQKVAEVQQAVWQRLVQVGTTCLRALQNDSASQGSWLHELVAGLGVGVSFAVWVLHILSPTGNVPLLHPKPTWPLKLGFANPGVSGCLDFKGKNANWSPLLDKERGICLAIKTLGIDAAGLSAPRLQPDTRAPSQLEGVLSCRGGPAYSSTAVLRMPWLAQHSAVREDIGGDRRMWTDILLEGGQCLHWATLSFPPEGSHRDAEWIHELESLTEDIEHLSQLASHTCAPLFLCTGDMNMQPDGLGTSPEKARIRQRSWEQFLTKHGFCTFNPVPSGVPAVPISLPVRNRQVSIFPHSTRHDSRGIGRAIDIVFGSSCLCASVTIHNSIHCGGSDECPVHNCQELGCGDHFMLQVDVSLTPEDTPSSAAPRFPGKWCDVKRWHAALKRARAPLEQITSVALRGYEDRSTHPDIAITALEAATMLLNTVAGSLRDLWLGGPDPGAEPQKEPRLSDIASLVESNAPEDIQLLAQQLRLIKSGDQLLQRTCRLLRRKTPEPVSCMMKEGRLLTEAETLQAWQQALTDQGGHHTSDRDCGFQLLISNRLRTLIDQARHERQSNLETPFLQLEVADIISEWRPSKAMPPDLLPRAIFLCNNEGWNDAIWALQKWAGPSGLAHKPSLWRSASLCPIHKKGNPAEVDNFRLIFIKAQMGLLQEALLTQRWLGTVRQYVLPCQSGFVRGVEDAWLLLHETSAEAMSQGRPLWTVMGDFRKAFPSVIRQDLLHSLAVGPGICGDSLLLLNSILQKDVVSIWFSGFSEVTITTGIPEGGTLGPFAYPCLLDSLVRELLAAECGVGLQVNIPNAWASMQWRGQGSPCQETVNLLKAAIQRNTPLPHVSLLVAVSTLEASALKALSDLAPHRLAAILHADDPVLLGSCRGELQRSLHIVANWAHRHGAAFHVGDNKTISMICGQQAVPPLLPSDTQLYLPGRGSEVDCTLHTKAEHKWLGITWTKSLSFHKSLCQKATLASAIWGSICALLRSKALPMDLAMSLFRTKVLPTLLQGACMYGIENQLEEFLSDLQNSWARQIFDLDTWRNAAVAIGELGWTLPLHLEVVIEVAMRRFRLWQLPDDDTYKLSFMYSHSIRSSWASKSLAVLRYWDILDWVEWQETQRNYREYLRSHLERIWFDTWSAEAAKSRQPPTYTSFQSAPSRIVNLVARSSFSWEVRVAVFALCKIRAGALTLSSLNGRRSSAKIQRCIFCNTRTRAARIHVMASCSFWCIRRDQVKGLLGLSDNLQAADLCRAIFCCSPQSRAFPTVATWAAEVDRGCTGFWANNR